jgi:hypothetical protein
LLGRLAEAGVSERVSITEPKPDWMRAKVRLDADVLKVRSTLRDANVKLVSSSSSYDYIQSDDVHPTYTGGTVSAGLWGGSTGTGAPRYTSFTGGKSPIWNSYGHERMGWTISVFNPPAP